MCWTLRSGLGVRSGRLCGREEARRKLTSTSELRAQVRATTRCFQADRMHVASPPTVVHHAVDRTNAMTAIQYDSVRVGKVPLAGITCSSANPMAGPAITCRKRCDGLTGQKPASRPASTEGPSWMMSSPSSCRTIASNSLSGIGGVKTRYDSHARQLVATRIAVARRTRDLGASSVQRSTPKSAPAAAPVTSHMSQLWSASSTLIPRIVRMYASIVATDPARIPTAIHEIRLAIGASGE